MIGHTPFLLCLCTKAKQSKAKQWMAHFLVERASRIQAGHCIHAEVAQPVGLQQHKRWRSPEGTAEQVEEAPLYCMALSAAGRMTDGFSPFAKEQKLILVRASAVAE
jgi:hypothetical protein